MGNTNLQLAAFYDRVGDTVLTGTGEVTSAGGFLLPDVTSGTFNYAGKNLLDTSWACGSSCSTNFRPT